MIGFKRLTFRSVFHSPEKRAGVRSDARSNRYTNGRLYTRERGLDATHTLKSEG